ncbi:hypothetical protein [Verrucosispora sioxanthis]|uniref:hypothetical protein n=1 Tax=Verrucosispora sioxanthis TaxID=2499994 RepID=UPI001C0FD746|nr:hypothetical protein [Verrucosispora sioxanthis]
MVVRVPGGGYGDHLRPHPTPTPVRVTVLAFALLSLLFALATAHRSLATTGSLGAVAFFAVMATACGLVALAARRRWAPYPAYALAGLLAAASLGLLGAITIVGLGLLAWVVLALNTRSARDWFGRPGRLR